MDQNQEATTPEITTVRLQFVIGHDRGTESCDYRGEKFIGAHEGDHHKTVLEKDVPVDDPLVAEALELGPRMNAFLSKLTAPTNTIVEGLTGEDAFMRVGVLDKIAPKD